MLINIHAYANVLICIFVYGLEAISQCLISYFAHFALTILAKVWDIISLACILLTFFATKIR